MNVSEVKTRKDEQQWIGFPAKLYKGDPHYVRPMDSEIRGIFNPMKNRLFRHGEACRWLLFDEKKIIGRIAAFYDQKTSDTYAREENGQPTGGCGFFDCIDNQDAANLLFDTAKNWLQQRGLEAMDGPVNFGDRDYFWGCLIEGFSAPVYNMPYNFPYYGQLFENYGFQVFFRQLTLGMGVTNENMSPVIHEKYERLMRNPGYTFEIVDKKNLYKYADDFMTIYNEAWGVIPGVAKISRQHAHAMLDQLKPILDPRLMHFAYYEGEPVAFFLNMPDLNQAYKGLNGKDHLLNKLRILWRVKVAHRCDRAISLAFGVVPKQRVKGLEAALVYSFEQQALKKDFPYNNLQFNWIGDFNLPMIKLARSVGAEIVKTHATYRYLFDREKPFTRAKLQK